MEWHNPIEHPAANRYIIVKFKEEFIMAMFPYKRPKYSIVAMSGTRANCLYSDNGTFISWSVVEKWTYLEDLEDTEYEVEEID